MIKKRDGRFNYKEFEEHLLGVVKSKYKEFNIDDFGNITLETNCFCISDGYFTYCYDDFSSEVMINVFEKCLNEQVNAEIKPGIYLTRQKDLPELEAFFEEIQSLEEIIGTNFPFTIEKITLESKKEFDALVLILEDFIMLHRKNKDYDPD